MRRILGFVVALLSLLGAGLILWRALPVTVLAVPAADAAGAPATPSPPLEAPGAPPADR